MPRTTLRARHTAGITAGVALAALLSGCGSTPLATRYLLPAVEAPRSAPTPASARNSPTDAPAIRLAEVRLPSYLSEGVIAHLRPDGSVAASPGEQWAEDPQQAMTRALGRAIRDASGATVIYEPWPIGLDSARSVAISIHRLLGTLGGETHLRGQFLMVSREQVLRVRDFDLRAPVVGVDTAALLRSYAQVLAQLAAMIAAELTSS